MIANSHGVSIAQEKSLPGVPKVSVSGESVMLSWTQPSKTWAPSGSDHPKIGTRTSASPSDQNVTTIVNVIVPIGSRRRW
jgi:hypothetical protein